MSIRVIIAGFKGRMGQAACQMVLGDPALDLVAVLDPFAQETEWQGIPVFKDKTDLIGFDADVWVDFTTPAVAYENTHFALEQGFAPVVGTTGFTSEQITELTNFSRDKNLGGLIAPNFALGAVLLMQFAAQAAKYFPNVEIIELHHDKKKDAPSGTAIKTAELMAEVREPIQQGASDEEELIAGARGANFDGMRIHSVRLPGLVAHQEVIFGNQGEGLTLRHDSYDRSSFMTGVNLGIKEVVKRHELVYGLMPSEFQKALPVLEKIKEAGFEAYFVGGSVRDALLNRPIHDVDIATSSYPEETKQIFSRTVDIGIEHGTVLVLEGEEEYEVTTFRTEDVYVDYRRPSAVSFVRSLEEDLKRRDFTVNAFALDETGEIVDLFDGLKDLENQILRAVGVASERFNEDALRIMRGFRFQASLGFELETETFKAMKVLTPLLEKISIERTFVEFDKLLLAPYWRVGLSSMIESQAYDYLPDMAGSQDKLQSLFDLEDNFTFESSEQAWAALLWALEVEDAQQFLKHWKTSRQFAKQVQDLLTILSLREGGALSKRDCYQFNLDSLLQAENLRRAQGKEINPQAIIETYESLTIHDKKEMQINGGILIKEYGYQPGPELGDVLDEIEYAIVDGVLKNDRQAIHDYLRGRK